MRTISYLDVGSDELPSIDCLVVDESDVARVLLHQWIKKARPVIMRCDNSKRSIDSDSLSHDVFKSLDQVLGDFLEHHCELARRFAADCKKYVMLVWNGVFDQVYPHVWDELKQVYNVEFVKIEV